MTTSPAVPGRVLFALCALACTVVGCTNSPDEALEGREVSSQARGDFASYTLYVDPDTHAADQADTWRTSDPVGAAIMDDLASVPSAKWIGSWIDDPADEVDDALTDAGNQLRTLVVYNIPDRDCGSFSAGGATSEWEYSQFIDAVAEGLDGRLALVILEPDGLALDDCLDSDELAERHQMLSDAVDTLTAAGAAVYLDAGDSNWIPADDMADRLLAAGVEQAAGFALNVSHTEFSYDEAAYANEIRDIVGEDARYVIDTSRNGLGPTEDQEWCNPIGRANGRRPSLNVARDGMDARLWIKTVGASDGSCNGGPEAGDWWPEYARGLWEEADLLF